MKVFLLLLLILLSCNSDCPKITLQIGELKGYYYEQSSNQVIRLSEGVITNNTSESYYTWIDFRTLFDEQESGNHARKYLSMPFGDFSLIQLLCEDVFFHEEFSPIIGVSFLKKITPGASFKYLVDWRICEKLNGHIFYVSESDYKQIVGNTLNEQMILYDKDEILITLSNGHSSIITPI